MISYKGKEYVEYDNAIALLEEKDKEIERLKEMKLHTEKYASEMEDKYILEKSKNNKAIEYMQNIHWFDLRNSEGLQLYATDKNFYNELKDILKGVDKE